MANSPYPVGFAAQASIYYSDPLLGTSVDVARGGVARTEPAEEQDTILAQLGMGDLRDDSYGSVMATAHSF